MSSENKTARIAELQMQVSALYSELKSNEENILLLTKRHEMLKRNSKVVVVVAAAAAEAVTGAGAGAVAAAVAEAEAVAVVGAVAVAVAAAIAEAVGKGCKHLQHDPPTKIKLPN